MSSPSLANIRIVLVEPAGPLNIGSVARVMKNMGLNQLVLVNPQCDPVGTEARQMAVHAADILETAQQVQTIPLALTGCYRAIATTARPRTLSIPLENPRQTLPWLLGTPSALLFGPEDRGLNNEELSYAQRFISIPSHPDYPALNLAQAVAVCCYELYQCTQQPQSAQTQPDQTQTAQTQTAQTQSTQIQWTQAQGLSDQGLTYRDAPLDHPASLDAIEQYFQHLERVLLQIGYLYPHTAASRMQKFRHLYQRSQLSPAELALLRGTLRQIEWAVQRAHADNP